jgi:hypothetical protein
MSNIRYHSPYCFSVMTSGGSWEMIHSLSPMVPPRKWTGTIRAANPGFGWAVTIADSTTNGPILGISENGYLRVWHGQTKLTELT